MSKTKWSLLESFLGLEIKQTKVFRGFQKMDYGEIWTQKKIKFEYGLENQEEDWKLIILSLYRSSENKKSKKYEEDSVFCNETNRKPLFRLSKCYSAFLLNNLMFSNQRI